MRRNKTVKMVFWSKIELDFTSWWIRCQVSLGEFSNRFSIKRRRTRFPRRFHQGVEFEAWIPWANIPDFASASFTKFQSLAPPAILLASGLPERDSILSNLPGFCSQPGYFAQLTPHFFGDYRTSCSSRSRAVKLSSSTIHIHIVCVYSPNFQKRK